MFYVVVMGVRYLYGRYFLCALLSRDYGFLICIPPIVDFLSVSL